MSPTQFPEGYQMAVDAARRFDLEHVPDAYVVLGNGTINAYASGHRLPAVRRGLLRPPPPTPPVDLHKKQPDREKPENSG